MGDEERVAAEQRERLRAERKKDRERELRMDVSGEDSSFFSRLASVACVVVLLIRRMWGVRTGLGTGA